MENALNDMTTDPVARMKDCILKIRHSGTEEDHSETVEVALEELIEWTEHIDFAIGNVAKHLVEQGGPEKGSNW